MDSLNLGILAHVDAGKTTLTERLLYTAGIIDEFGSVDKGNTQTDSLALEKQRGITIKSAVVSFVLNNKTINLIDTPGHPDFIAEVERVLNVLDGVVLVVSAVEGVQAQTRVLMKTLKRLKIPTIIFVNKIDRKGADAEKVIQQITEKLTPSVIQMGTATAQGSKNAVYKAYTDDHKVFVEKLTELLVDHDDDIANKYLSEKTPLTYKELKNALTNKVANAEVHPVFSGSAMVDVGISELIEGITSLLPTSSGNPNKPLSSSVFKVDRTSSGEKEAYIRVFDGTLNVRDKVQFGSNNADKVTSLTVFEAGSTHQTSSLIAGSIGKVSGLTDIQIGDTIGNADSSKLQHYFASPTLETVITSKNPSEKGRLFSALTQLEEQDPLINVRQDDVRQELYVSLYGEVQKEVIQATLLSEYNIETEFRKTSTICIERLLGVGAAYEKKTQVGKNAPPFDGISNPFLATIGLRVEPGEIGSGVTYALETSLGSMPLAFFNAVEATVKETLEQGLYGWKVTDCRVFMTDSGYWPRQSAAHATFDKSISSTARDFRQLTPLVLMEALKKAKTIACEPIHQFNLEIPQDSLEVVLSVLPRFEATAHKTSKQKLSYEIEGTIPIARIHEFRQKLPSLTKGEGIFDSALSHYEPIHGKAPTRPRTDLNPLDREGYLAHFMR